MSRINPYFEGENSALCNPINKMDDNTSPVECVRNPAVATTIISISANFAQTTIFRFLYIFANRPANGENSKYGITNAADASVTTIDSFSFPTQAMQIKHASVFRKLSFKTPR